MSGGGLWRQGSLTCLSLGLLEELGWGAGVQGHTPDITEMEGPAGLLPLGPCLPASCYEKNKLVFNPMSAGLFVTYIRIPLCRDSRGGHCD